MCLFAKIDKRMFFNLEEVAIEHINFIKHQDIHDF